MVEYRNTAIDENKLDLVFHALADRTRRSLLSRITGEAQRVTDLAKSYDFSLNAISKHIKVLEKASLVTRTIVGRTHYCQMNANELATAQEWIKQYEKFWTDRLDALEEFVVEQESKKKGDKNE